MRPIDVTSAESNTANPWRILVAEALGKEGLDLLRQKAAVDVRLRLSPVELQAIIPPYHALIVRSATKVTDDLLAAGRELVVVGRAGVGLDNIDVDAATRRGVLVANAPTTNIVAAAEHTIALMFAMARNISQADHAVRARQWQREMFTGVELVGKRLGLVGLGRVGSEVARRAQGLGMEVLVYDPYVPLERAQQFGVRPVSFDDLLAFSDFVSLHTPLTVETREMFRAREFGKMRQGARLVNTARGPLVDEAALLDALDAGQIAGAALDVFDREPPDNPRLLENERVVMTPHIGGSTKESQARVSIQIAEEVLSALEGQPVRFAVNAPFVPPSLARVLVPYLTLAERLGSFYIQWVGGPLGDIEIDYAGPIAGEDTSILTAALIKGLLEHIYSDRINLVNAQAVSHAYGLKVVERRTLQISRYENLITINGARQVAGAVLRDQPHIVELDGKWVDFAATGYLLLTRHHDRPGMIGAVGTLLGNADINIASMVVARDTPRGESIMVLSLDDPVPPPVFDHLRAQPDIEWVKLLRL
jgi:D-3-phosphoglycerate dehydrogenase / 2-oxoglutarate reductase